MAIETTVSTLSSAELIQRFSAAKRAAMNADLQSRIALSEFEHNTKLTPEQRLQKYDDAIEYAGLAEDGDRLADVVNITHREKYLVSAHDVLKDRIMTERRELQRRMSRVQKRVAEGSDKDKMNWFNTYCALVKNDNDLEVVK